MGVRSLAAVAAAAEPPAPQVSNSFAHTAATAAAATAVATHHPVRHDDPTNISTGVAAKSATFLYDKTFKPLIELAGKWCRRGEGGENGLHGTNYAATARADAAEIFEALKLDTLWD